MHKQIIFSALAWLAGTMLNVGWADDSAVTVTDPKFEPVMATIKTCEACHGANGLSVIPLQPILAGQHLNYTYIQLKDFKSGSRKNAIMNPIAAGLEKSDMLLIAEYFSKQAWPTKAAMAAAEATTETKTEPADVGKEVKAETVDVEKVVNADGTSATTGLKSGGLDEQTIRLANSVIVGGQCVQCHLGGFEGNSGVPRTDGQHFEYLKKTLMDFKSRERNNAPDKATLMSDFSDEQLIAAARYIASLPLAGK